MDPVIVVLDEPTSNLDPRARRRLIEDLRGSGGIKVIASHDLDFVWQTCNQVAILEKGAVVAKGPCRELLRNQMLLEAHGLEVPLLAICSENSNSFKIDGPCVNPHSKGCENKQCLVFFRTQHCPHTISL